MFCVNISLMPTYLVIFCVYFPGRRYESVADPEGSSHIPPLTGHICHDYTIIHVKAIPHIS